MGAVAPVAFIPEASWKRTFSIRSRLLRSDAFRGRRNADKKLTALGIISKLSDLRRDNSS